MSQPAVGLPPLGAGFPQDLKINVVHSLPVELSQRLESARKSGRYFIVVAEASEQGDLEIYRYSSEGYKSDWFLRTWKEVGKQIMSFDPPLPQPET